MAVNKVEINGEVKLDLTGDTVTAATLQKGVTAHNKAGVKVTGTLEVPTQQTKVVELSMESGDQTISPDSGKVLSKVTVNKPSTLIPANIKKDVVIGGVTGTLESGGTSGQSETWVLNNEINVSKKFSYAIGFVSNGVEYESISVSGKSAPTASGLAYALTYGDQIILNSEQGGMFPSIDSDSTGLLIYRKITFKSAPTAALLDWLEANAVKQPSDQAIQTNKSITITSNGTTAITPDAPYDAMSKVDVTVDSAGSGTQKEYTNVTITANSMEIPYALIYKTSAGWIRDSSGYENETFTLEGVEIGSTIIAYFDPFTSGAILNAESEVNIESQLINDTIDSTSLGGLSLTVVGANASCELGFSQ